MTDKLKNFIVRTVTGVLFVAVMVVGIAFRPEAMMVLFALITGLTMWEFTGLVNDIKTVSVNRFINTVAGVYLFLAVFAFCTQIQGAVIFIPYLLTVIYLFISELYLQKENPLQNWAYSMFSQMYVALPFSTINVLAFQTSAETMEVQFVSILPLSVFIFLWTNDSGAYCSGSLFGKHKLFPRVSPGKSWEGSIGGGILVLIVAAFIGWSGQNGLWLAAGVLSIAEWMGLGMVVVFFGTWGDLVESLFKRTLGIKDSGNVLPGHGGMLDRFDSSLMAIPASAVYLASLQML